MWGRIIIKIDNDAIKFKLSKFSDNVYFIERETVTQFLYAEN